MPWQKNKEKWKGPKALIRHNFFLLKKGLIIEVAERKERERILKVIMAENFTNLIKYMDV